ncbi:aminotransferase class I/II-fold pyridoxal phosphate-dependent enzyme [Sinorhizobium psoraleae]|uniref:aminotransferase class I/II-fold pyridoxal phosphate-dependent enzyme n=1 Tax=Sinorhizobium psoraleae TaxID=520838 RepID=UPI0035E3CE91
MGAMKAGCGHGSPVPGRSALTSFLANARPWPKAAGGFYFYLDLSRLLQSASGNGGPTTADDIVDSLLSKAGVAAVSGTTFGDPTGLRISYGLPPEKLRIGLSRIVEVLNAWG